MRFEGGTHEAHRQREINNEKERERKADWPGSVSACLTPGDFTAAPRDCKIGQDWASGIRDSQNYSEAVFSTTALVLYTTAVKPMKIK